MGYRVVKKVVVTDLSPNGSIPNIVPIYESSECLLRI